MRSLAYLILLGSPLLIFGIFSCNKKDTGTNENLGSKVTVVPDHPQGFDCCGRELLNINNSEVIDYEKPRLLVAFYLNYMKRLSEDNCLLYSIFLTDFYSETFEPIRSCLDSIQRQVISDNDSIGARRLFKLSLVTSAPFFMEVSRREELQAKFPFLLEDEYFEKELSSDLVLDFCNKFEFERPILIPADHEYRVAKEEIAPKVRSLFLCK